VRRSGVPECSRFISALEPEDEEGLVWSSTARTFVAFRGAGFSATRRSTQLSGAFLKRDKVPQKFKAVHKKAANLQHFGKG
jgi:hypothetical protein